jgi:hypothetical protein
MTKKEKEAQEEKESKEYLLTLIKPGDTVYTSLDHVSQSGMSRRIGVYIARIDKDREYTNGKPYIQRITWHVAKLLSYRMKNDALVVGGCGMDMGFRVVYRLSSMLFRNNYRCTGKNCLSNDHINGQMNPREDHKGELHSDGGYALRHEWL